MTDTKTKLQRFREHLAEHRPEALPLYDDTFARELAAVAVDPTTVRQVRWRIDAADRHSLFDVAVGDWVILDCDPNGVAWSMHLQRPICPGCGASAYDHPVDSEGAPCVDQAICRACNHTWRLADGPAMHDAALDNAPRDATRRVHWKLKTADAEMLAGRSLFADDEFVFEVDDDGRVCKARLQLAPFCPECGELVDDPGADGRGALCPICAAAEDDEASDAPSTTIKVADTGRPTRTRVRGHCFRADLDWTCEYCGAQGEAPLDEGDHLALQIPAAPCPKVPPPPASSGPRCPACGSAEVDNLGDGQQSICLACNLTWAPDDVIVDYYVRVQGIALVTTSAASAVPQVGNEISFPGLGDARIDEVIYVGKGRYAAPLLHAGGHAPGAARALLALGWRRAPQEGAPRAWPAGPFVNEPYREVPQPPIPTRGQNVTPSVGPNAAQLARRLARERRADDRSIQAELVAVAVALAELRPHVVAHLDHTQGEGDYTLPQRVRDVLDDVSTRVIALGCRVARPRDATMRGQLASMAEQLAGVRPRGFPEAVRGEVLEKALLRVRAVIDDVCDGLDIVASALDEANTAGPAAVLRQAVRSFLIEMQGTGTTPDDALKLLDKDSKTVDQWLFDWLAAHDAAASDKRPPRETRTPSPLPFTATMVRRVLRDFVGRMVENGISPAEARADLDMGEKGIDEWVEGWCGPAEDVDHEALQIVPRLDEDGRQLFGEPEFRAALSHISGKLGLSGMVHLVTDVVPAFEALLESRPAELPRVLELLRRAKGDLLQGHRANNDATASLLEMSKLLVGEGGLP